MAKTETPRRISAHGNVMARRQAVEALAQAILSAELLQASNQTPPCPPPQMGDASGAHEHSHCAVDGTRPRAGQSPPSSAHCTSPGGGWHEILA
jgi:hypothetical protein